MPIKAHSFFLEVVIWYPIWYHVDMGVKPIGKVTCEDCGPSIVARPADISIFYDGDDYNGITVCSFCQRSVYVPIGKELARTFSEKGVKVFSWLTGELIEKELV